MPNLLTNFAGRRWKAALSSAARFGIYPLACALVVAAFGVGSIGDAVQPVAASDTAGLSEGHRLHFTSEPTEAEIFNARVFDEPLLALGGRPLAAENRALAQAMAAYADRTNLDDFSSFSGFLENFPVSAWRGSLLLHLATEYFNYGYYSKALSAWELAWKELAPINSGPGKAQADRALGELAQMYSKLGRLDQLNELLKSVEGRNIEGPAVPLMRAARDASRMMEMKPDFCFKCGPLALERIRTFLDPRMSGDPILRDARSGTNGFCLNEVADLARRTGMNYQMAYREPGAHLITPAVIHWKVGHYAALIRSDGERYLVQDFTFRNTVWMTATALDEEVSGYFLVPAGALPAGWRSVNEPEGGQVWGKGFVSGWALFFTTIYDLFVGGSKSNDCGMATYNMHAMLVSLSLNDTPVGYHPPVGPSVYFTASYHQLEANQPASFYYSNLGQKWTCNWVSYITDNPTSPNADVTLYVEGGGTLTFTGFNTTSQSYLTELMSQTRLVKLSGSSYEQQFPDGTRRQFTMSDGSVGSVRRIFLTKRIDAAGNALTLNYDSHLRITNIVDAIGQATTLSYTNTAYTNAITAVSDPFGRTAYFQYDPTGMLIQITDVLGLTSQFAYGTNQFVNALTTPYGTTTFASGQTNGPVSTVLFLRATDPLGQSELLMYSQSSGLPHSLPAPQVPHGLSTFNLFIDGRDSLFWSKKAFAEGAGDYTKARVYHWLHYTPISTDAAPILESYKDPLESRVWFNYSGQSTNYGPPYYLDAAYTGSTASPSAVARVLDDGTTQISFYGYNALGNLTNSIDPVGRSFSFIYDTNSVDLLETRMTHNGKNDLIQRVTYNSQHLPLTITDAAGQTATNTYNARGQLLTATDPKGNTTTFSYDSNGYLLAVDGPLPGTNDTTGFTYEGLGRVRTITDTDGYTLTFDYDNLDRIVRVTYPDGTTNQFVYSRLDLATIGDRLGRWTTNTHNAIRQLVQSRDPLGRITAYSWCQCGSPTTLIDPMGRTTVWRYDVEGRVTAKQYADGSTITYTYEDSTARLKSKRDENGQETDYAYYPDNRLKQASYPNAVIPTPPIIYTYDPDYERPSTMQDGIGLTQWSYYPAGVLGALRAAQISGPWPNETVTFTYDELGYVNNRSINGVAETRAYDGLGRITNIVNALGQFKYTYDAATARIQSLSYPNGQTNHYDYLSNSGDHRLQRITHQKSDASVISRFTYAYDPFGSITNWLQELGGFTPAWSIACDAANQLTSVNSSQGGTNLNYSYTYDAAGNRLSETIGSVTRTFQYNALNQLASSSDPNATAATYEWDADQKLTAINAGTNRSEFYYDGLARLSRIVEKVNGLAVSEKRFVWCVGVLCQERAADNSLVKQFFPQGMLTATGAVFYTWDHLGSIRELLDSAGNLHARYAYQPYGSATKLTGDMDADFTFTGFYRHAPSGALWAFYRAYDPSTARWLTRDPLEERGDPNLYRYVGSSPINYLDLLGLIVQVDAEGQADYDTAVAYLSQNVQMKIIFKKLQESSTVFHVKIIHNHKDEYDPNTKTISWDPTSALRTDCGGRQSPALGLGHEADHAYADLYVPQYAAQWGNTADKAYDDLEEKRVITGSEANAARTLGEDTRTSHGGTPYRVAGPTGR